MKGNMEIFNQVKAIAQDKLNCTCGNADWEQFIYIGPAAVGMVAGCKRCGNIKQWNGIEWTRRTKNP